ncbi:MAG: serine/threonine protein kinase [Polyangiaceae bacterium]|nr:serine/threonine protein kinase [Polyangiaceae bacterium]
MRTLREIQPGQTVGRYEFLLPIAQGGMAAVWAARLKGSRGFSKLVAVKTMLPGFSDEPQFEQMFLDEARIASRIRHPHVVEIYDLGEQDDMLYLVMEWVDGHPLSALRAAAAKSGGVPLPVGVKIVADACAGLHAAHELRDELGEPLGLVHRDMSPQNLLISYGGDVKIGDFGVAKAAGRTSENTAAGHVKGKPPYMSPEQALGLRVDRRSDVFALGIVLYQVTAGQHPLRGETDVATLQNIISGPEIMPPRERVPGYPKALEAVVLKALARDPEKRFQTARDMELALEDAYGPSLPRVRTEEVGQVITALLGREGEERRAALRVATGLADQRELGTVGRAGGLPRADDVQTVVEPGRMPSVSDERSEDVASTAGTVSRPSWLTDPRPLRGWWVALAVLAAGVVLGAAGAVGGGLLRSTPSSNAADGNAGHAPVASVGVPTTFHDSAARAHQLSVRAGAEVILESEGRATGERPTSTEPGLQASDAGPSRASTSSTGRKPQTSLRHGPEVREGDPGFVPPPIQNPGF